MRTLTADTKIRLSQINWKSYIQDKEIEKWIKDRTFKDGDVTTHADGSVWKRDAPGKWYKIKQDKYTAALKDEYNKNPFDKNGKHFITSSKGSIDFGYINKEQAGKMRQKPAPIRLSEGTKGPELMVAKKKNRAMRFSERRT